MAGIGRPGAARTLLSLAAGAALAASGCEGNVGQTSTGPVTFRVSVGVNNEQAAGASSAFSATADGNLVCFSSLASNISTDPSGFMEIFVKHRDTGWVENVTKLATFFSQASLDDCDAPFISADGAYVIFASKGSLNGSFPAPQATRSVWVAFRSVSAGLYTPVFASGGWPDMDCGGASIASDGVRTLAVYQTASTNIIGTWVGAPAGTNVYAFDLENLIPTNILVSHAPAGNTTYPADSSRDAVISADARYIVFSSKADLTSSGAAFEQIYRYTVATQALALVSEVPGSPPNTPANGHCLKPSVSRDGRFVAFSTLAMNLGSAGGTNALAVVRDMDAAGSVITAVGDQSVYLNFGSGNIGFPIGMSDDGRYFAYGRVGTSFEDVQIRFVDLRGGATTASLTPGGQPGDSYSLLPALSADGRWVFWVSKATDLVLGDSNYANDVFGRGPMR